MFQIDNLKLRKMNIQHTLFLRWDSQFITLNESVFLSILFRRDFKTFSKSFYGYINIRDEFIRGCLRPKSFWSTSGHFENLSLQKLAWKPINNLVMNCVDQYSPGNYQVHSIMNSLDLVRFSGKKLRFRKSKA